MFMYVSVNAGVRVWVGGWVGLGGWVVGRFGNWGLMDIIKFEFIQYPRRINEARIGSINRSIRLCLLIHNLVAPVLVFSFLAILAYNLGQHIHKRSHHDISIN